MSLKDLNCDEVSSIADIQEAGSYIDQTGENDGSDKNRVSCLQKQYKDKNGNLKPYNELKEFMKKHFPSDIDNILEDIYTKVCKCCKEKGKEVWSWDKLKKCIDEK